MARSIRGLRLTVNLVYFRIAYCQDNNCDPKDPLDKFIDDLKGKLDISWDKIQDSLLNDQMKETVSLIGSILESLKQFDMPEIEYLTPRPILILLLKKTQEYIDKQNNLNKEPIEINETEFEDDKKIGQYALNVYGASWAWMGDPKDAALKMGLSPGLSFFSFLSFFCFLSFSFECLWSILGLDG